MLLRFVIGASQVLKRNLSPEVMKLVRMPDTNVSPMKPRTNASATHPQSSAPATPATAGAAAKAAAAPVADSMLQQLLADVNQRNVVFSEDLSTSSSRPAGSGTSACDQEGAHLNWMIELVNSQVT